MRTQSETATRSSEGVSTFQAVSLALTIISVTAAQFKMFEHADLRTMTIVFGTASLAALVVRGIFVGINRYRSQRFSRRLLLLFSLMLLVIVVVRVVDQFHSLAARDTRLITSAIYIGCLVLDAMVYNWVTIKNILVGSVAEDTN